MRVTTVKSSLGNRQYEYGKGDEEECTCFQLYNATPVA
jgi:hypothetical protein